MSAEDKTLEGCSNIYKVCTKQLNFMFCDIIILFFGKKFIGLKLRIHNIVIF